MELHRKMIYMTPIDAVKIVSFSLTYFEHVLENTTAECKVLRPGRPNHLIKQTQSCPVAFMHFMPFGILNVLALELHMH